MRVFLLSCHVRVVLLRSELAGKNDQLQQMALKLEEYKENMIKVISPALPPRSPMPPNAAGDKNTRCYRSLASVGAVTYCVQACAGQSKEDKRFWLGVFG